jgi:hypothetical protein
MKDHRNVVPNSCGPRIRAGTIDPKGRLRGVFGSDHGRTARDSGSDRGGLRRPCASVTAFRIVALLQAGTPQVDGAARPGNSLVDSSRRYGRARKSSFALFPKAHRIESPRCLKNLRPKGGILTSGERPLSPFQAEPTHSKNIFLPCLGHQGLCRIYASRSHPSGATNRTHRATVQFVDSPAVLRASASS